MKKTFIRFGAVALIGLALTACNNDAANKTAMDADNTAIDNMVNDHLKMVDDSISKVCDDAVTAAATAKADSMMKAGHHDANNHTTAHHTAAAPKKEAHQVDPQKARNGSGSPVDAQKQRNADPAKSDATNQHKRN